MTNWRTTLRIWIGLAILVVGLQACGGGDKKEEKAAPPPTAEAAISGTITLDPALKDKVPKDPLLMIMASKSGDSSKPAIIVKRVPAASFPHEYRLTAEDITLVGSTFDGRVYVTARIDQAGMVGPPRPGNFGGAYAGNPVAVGSTRVDIVINKPY